MLKKALLLISGNAASSALLLVRNLLLARLISIENYGIAATFAMIMAVVEMMSSFGLHQMIVQDKDGDKPEMQAGLQGFQVMRGAISSGLLFLLAYPYAKFLGVPEVTWAYHLVAIVPLLNAFTHFDVHRLKRHMNFMPSIMATTVPALLSVLILWPLANAFGDYRVMLYSILVQGVATVVVSHLMAKRRYKITFDRALIARSMGFGWPLLLNGALLFAVFNGEKLVVGRELGMAALAVYSMGVTLTITPTLVLAGSAQSFFLPQLSKAQQDDERFRHLSMATMQSSLAIGIFVSLGTVMLGGPFVHLLLGEKYQALILLITPFAVANGIRVCKAGSAVVALAKGRTGNSMIANIPRVVSIPISWWIAVKTGNVLLIVWVSVLAEVIGYVMSLYLVKTRVGVSLKMMTLPVMLSFLCFLAVYLDSLAFDARPGFVENLHLGQAAVFALAVAALATMCDLGRYIMRRGK